MRTRQPRLISLGLLAGLLAAGAVALTLGAQQGGIVPTKSYRFTITPGPEPDVTLFATGECIGKIEPCG